ncbi:hypothetical protein FISHEDRAFT_50777 [Fistulina hepatica ATCC 64428]|uniref:histone acetyltransferase n=1 Tax=Fistulina hepatica ATCC 64428 TaxID=1128425 RepID=A0A0D7A1E2_9AGAR|nr:hypothetical protein FISHEDRAFT_50777 [Fistulina hepatica ATCC 64428]
MSVQCLRDYLLESLRAIPGTRDFRLYVFVSSPKKHTELYQFARPRPKVYAQDILILVSEFLPNIPEDSMSGTPPADSETSRHVFVTAVEATVFHVPATSSAIFYVSKVDTTGQGAYPSPTSFIVRSLLVFYVDPATRPIPVEHVWIHLFARAQPQYVFPNSADFTDKKPLTDVKLCIWWKRLLGEVAASVNKTSPAVSKTPSPPVVTQLYYVLPGYSESEARQLLKDTSETPWTYGHPYTQSTIPLPCPRVNPSSTWCNLGHFIPHFDDDPKSRFLDDLACHADVEGVKSPPRKRARTNTSGNKPEKPVSSADHSKEMPPGELSKVTPTEFWERISFRQECSSGAVTGFFVFGASCPSKSVGSSSPLAPMPGQVSPLMNKRIFETLRTRVEFSTRDLAVHATQTMETLIKGLCDDISAPSTGVLSKAPLLLSADARSTTPPSAPHVPSLTPPSTPPPRVRSLPDVSPNPFPEPVASLDTYHNHIFGHASVNNVPTERAERGGMSKDGVPKVTVLTARKKKKHA